MGTIRGAQLTRRRTTEATATAAPTPISADDPSLWNLFSLLNWTWTQVNDELSFLIRAIPNADPNKPPVYWLVGMVVAVRCGRFSHKHGPHTKESSCLNFLTGLPEKSPSVEYIFAFPLHWRASLWSWSRNILPHQMNFKCLWMHRHCTMDTTITEWDMTQQQQQNVTTRRQRWAAATFGISRKAKPSRLVIPRCHFEGVWRC